MHLHPARETLMTPKQTAYHNQANTIIKGLKKRGMDGYYFHTVQEAVDFANNMIEDGSTVTWGGSMTLQDSGLPAVLKDRDLTVLDRAEAGSPEEVQKIYRQAFSADYYLMSTNSITLDGQMVNIDGNGNRVAALIFGPQKVIIMAGMNKVAVDVEQAFDRVRNFATPANCNRLNLETPCSKTGKCGDCIGDSTICCEIVTTRRSRHPGRIHVILIGEELGY